MIKAITPADSATVVELAVASGLFTADDTSVLDKMLADYFNGNDAVGHMCIIDSEQEPLGVAYYAPAIATDRTWYLTLIAVHHDAQGQGHGTTLLQYVEQALQASGERLLLIETSGSSTFARTRAFYIKCGYEDEAHIRDFYMPGEDMVLFRKVLNPN